VEKLRIACAFDLVLPTRFHSRCKRYRLCKTIFTIDHSGCSWNLVENQITVTLGLAVLRVFQRRDDVTFKASNVSVAEAAMGQRGSLRICTRSSAAQSYRLTPLRKTMAGGGTGIVYLDGAKPEPIPNYFGFLHHILEPTLLTIFNRPCSYREPPRRMCSAHREGFYTAGADQNNRVFLPGCATSPGM